MGDDYERYLEELAQLKTEEEIAHHPELAKEKDALLRQKLEELKHTFQEKNARDAEELKKAGQVLIDWISTLPVDEKEKISLELSQINKKISSDDFAFKEFIKGEFSLQQLLEVSDELIQKIYHRAVHLQKEGHHLDASALLKFLILLNPFLADFWIGMGYSSMNVNELDEAKQYLDTAISIDPNNPRTYYFAAVCSKLMKDQVAAMNYCKEGLQLSNQEWNPIFNKLMNTLKS